MNGGIKNKDVYEKKKYVYAKRNAAQKKKGLRRKLLLNEINKSESLKLMLSRWKTG